MLLLCSVPAVVSVQATLQPSIPSVDMIWVLIPSSSERRGMMLLLALLLYLEGLMAFQMSEQRGMFLSVEFLMP